MKRIGILLSGRGSNFEAIAEIAVPLVALCQKVKADGEGLRCVPRIEVATHSPNDFVEVRV